MHRRRFLLGASASAGLLATIGTGTVGCSDAAHPGRERRAVARPVRTYGDTTLEQRPARSDAPNVLFIAIDDCNDWVGFLNRHPGTWTPNLDALAAESLSFDHAYCAAPMCGPARTSIAFGTHPYDNGVYDHSAQSDAAYEVLQRESASLIDDFWAAGYRTVGAGKIYHQQLPERWDDYRLTNWYVAGYQRKGPRADARTFDPDWVSPYDGKPIGRGEDFPYTQIDFGPSGRPPSEEPDGRAARWVAEQLRSMPAGPFFLGFGNYIPHDPWRVPQRFFDMHPLEGVVVPEMRPEDLDDLGPYARDEIIDKHHRYETLQQSGLLEEAVQAYQAAISFADDCVGIVLDQLASSPRAEDTVVALWSDHGYHMGEKLHIAKFTLWERSTRVPLLLKVPGRFDHEQHVDAAVSTMGLGSTLAELCGVESATPYLAGSLLPIVEDESLADDAPPITTWLEGNHSVRRGTKRYIRYRTGERELYDHEVDPDELDNVAADPANRSTIAELDAFLPPP